MLTISFYPLNLRDYSHIKELMKMSKCRVIVYLMGGQSPAGQRKYRKCPWRPPLDCTNIRRLQKDTPTNQHFHFAASLYGWSISNVQLCCLHGAWWHYCGRYQPWCSAPHHSSRTSCWRRAPQGSCLCLQSRWSPPPLTAQWTPSSPANTPAAEKTHTFQMLYRGRKV